MSARPVRVLVVDDSAVARLHLVRILESDPGIKVIAEIADGAAALAHVQEHAPDVVLMDINMPGMDGFEATRRIMETRAVPIVICSGATATSEVAVTFQALDAGAVACVEKPPSPAHHDFERIAANLRQTVALMAEVKVVRRLARGRSMPAAAPLAPTADSGGFRLVAIGASTGGPPVLHAILSGLPAGFPAPILVVQHIASGFLPGLAEWLGGAGPLRVEIAAHGIHPLPGRVYLAPDGCHMGVASGGRIVLSRGEPENGLRPAVSHLFRSVAAACGRRAVGVLLTGMGRDGAAELKMMRDQGSFTIAQDRKSSVVHGMPGAAIELNAAERIVAAEHIASLLIFLTQS